MKRFIFSAIVGLVALGGVAALSSTASAHDGDCGYNRFGGGGFGGYGGGFGGGFGGYYGNGGHDSVPHWHQTTTPFGSFNWYGLGDHDFQPHMHSVSPYSYQGYSTSPWGNTTSFYPRYPRYTYAPW